jgi:LDH2 family malate/lactate/ureidoglycolate dehydrogenase
MSEESYYVVEKEEMYQFMERCMVKAGSKAAHAKALADCLLAADYRGHYSHGLNRLGKSKANL